MDHWLGKKRYNLIRNAFKAIERALLEEMAAKVNAQEKELNGVLAREATMARLRGPNKDLQSRLRGLGLDFRLEWTHAGAEEEANGADFFVELDIDFKGFCTRKAILVQSKRLMSIRGPGAGDSDNDEYSAYEQAQANRMLNLTSSSYYLLYNPEAVRASSSDHESGLTWVAASTMVTFSKPPKFRDVVGHQVGFADFLMDAFIQTIVGDPRLTVDSKGRVHVERPHRDDDFRVERVLRLRMANADGKHPNS
jgi:hypothetical protein